MRSGSDQGFTIVGLLIAVAAINVALGVAMTTWVEIDRRAREAELIWRGNQYVRAIACYRAEGGGALPDKIEDLLENNCIRRLFKDPMTRDGEWRVLRVSDLAALQAAQGTEATPGTAIGAGRPGGGPRAGTLTGAAGAAFAATIGIPDQPGVGVPGVPGGAGLPTALGGQASAGGRMAAVGGLLRTRMERIRASRSARFGRLGPGASTDGIIGVVSTSNREGLRTIRDPLKKRYSDWWFVAGS